MSIPEFKSVSVRASSRKKERVTVVGFDPPFIDWLVAAIKLFPFALIFMMINAVVSFYVTKAVLNQELKGLRSESDKAVASQKLK